MAAWLLLTFFISLHNQLSSVSSIITYEYRCLKNFIHQLKMNDCSFQQVLWQKLGWLLSWHWKTLFLRGFVFKPTERAQVFLKNGSRDFHNRPPFLRSACFYMTIDENSERFQYFNFETDFLENKTFFKKLEYYSLVESTKIENASFPYKTTISESNVKTNRMVNTK